MNILDQAVQTLVKSLNQKFEDIFIEGLKLKGFEFDSREELEEFVKTRVKCDDYAADNTKIYCITEGDMAIIPFLLHKYNIPDIDVSPDMGTHSISASYGSFSYL